MLYLRMNISEVTDGSAEAERDALHGEIFKVNLYKTGGMIKILSFHFFCKYEIKIG